MVECIAMTGVQTLTDEQLLAETHRYARDERGATAGLVRRLAEMDARRLFLREGCASLFTWCTEVLHMSEAAAYNRIEVARIGRRFPAVFDALDEGSVTLTAVKVLGPYLTEANHAELLAEARHRSRREIEALLTGMTPPSPLPAAFRETTIHLAPGLHEIRFTITSATRVKLERARELLRHAVPNGEYAAIFDQALTVLLAQLERRRAASVAAPRPTRPARAGSRHIPSGVKREVWKRDGGRCAFVGWQGRRCTERGRLEFHHIQPFAAGGPTTVDNIALRCRQHNHHEAEAFFGEGEPLASVKDHPGGSRRAARGATAAAGGSTGSRRGS
jgi:5-methylcytosine-specific restriction endonuclease McrA